MNYLKENKKKLFLVFENVWRTGQDLIEKKRNLSACNCEIYQKIQK